MHDGHVLRLLTAACDMNQILKDNASNIFLSSVDATSLVTNIDIVLEAYSLLANEADDTAQLLWSLPPKAHWLYHLGQRAHFMNPRVGACLIDEEYVGALKIIVGKAAHATAAEVVPCKVMERMRWAMEFALVEAHVRPRLL